MMDNDDHPGIDSSLRERVSEAISITRDALDAASADPTGEALEELRKSADSLMRALGRVLIEIERQRPACEPAARESVPGGSVDN
jgi:hypothetical protein